jgi:hypothetical protein
LSEYHLDYFKDGNIVLKTFGYPDTGKVKEMQKTQEAELRKQTTFIGGSPAPNFEPESKKLVQTGASANVRDNANSVTRVDENGSVVVNEV